MEEIKKFVSKNLANSVQITER